MRTILLYLILATVLPEIAIAQKTKKITETSPEKFNPIKIVYEVLADHPEVKHGTYQRSNGKNLYQSGFYRNGKKDSIWQTYYRGNVVSRKIYNNGERTGIWEWWDRDQKLIFSYDFAKNEGKKLVEEKYPDTTTFYYQMPDGSWKTDPSVTPPVKLTTPSTWQMFLNSHLRYPQEAIDNDIQGTAVISVIVDENGDAVEYEALKGGKAPLDGEAIRVLKIFQPEFTPAVKDGKKIRARYKQPIVFRLENG